MQVASKKNSQTSNEIICEKNSEKQIGGSSSIRKGKPVKRNSRQKLKLRKVGQFFLQKSEMWPNVLPCWSMIQLIEYFWASSFWLPSTSFEQKICPVWAPNGPTLEFEVVGDRTYFIGLQNIHLKVKSRILRTNGGKLEYDAASASATDSPFFVFIKPHSFFSDCSNIANGFKISSANGK